MDSRRPIRRNPWSSIAAGGLIIMLGMGGFGLWAVSARLSAGALAPAMLVVESKRRNVQHLEGGIVAAIHVRDGDRVAQSDVLLTLDGTQAAVALELLDTQYKTARVELARLNAERDGLAALSVPGDLQLAGDNENPKLAGIISAQRNLFTARRSQLSGQKDILHSRIAQLDQQIEGMRAQEEAAVEQSRLIGEELKGLQELLKKGHTNRTRVLALQRAVADLKGQRGTRTAEISRARVAIGETELEILQLYETFNTEVIDQLRAVQDRLFDLEERRKAAADLNDRLDVRAPVSGIVVTSQVHTIGGVVEPGQVLMEVIPEGDRLTVEARISPQDIDLVEAGMTAEIKLSAFSQRNLPAIFGTVSVVSADIIADPRSGLSYYLAEINVPDNELEKLGDHELKPGMPSEVLIKAGEHTAWDYLTAPVADIINRAFRDM